MKYNIYAIGNMRRSPEAEIFLKYSKRIKNIEFFEYVSNFDEKNKKINDESKKLLSMIKNNGKKILLDEKGKILSSFEFSKLISDWRNHGHNLINFLIIVLVTSGSSIVVIAIFKKNTSAYILLPL